MTKPRCLRMSMDITMTILSVILMGGNFLFPAEIVHEILGLGFARIVHLISSHWYYLFMSLHIGLHGVYSFIARGVWKYLILRQQFFFFDLEWGYILFAMDYISIIILFATISHVIAKLLKKRFN